MKYYLGGYPSETSKGIHEVEFNEGKFSNLKMICDDEYTTYFDVSHDVLATVAKEFGQGVLVLNDLNGNRIDFALESKRPCSYLKMIEEANRIYTVSYHEAYVNEYALSNGKLELLKHIEYEAGAKCHCLVNNQAKDEIVVVALGLDTCFFYDFDFNEKATLKFPKGSGPRHALYAREDQFLYVLSETSNELFVVDRKKMKIIQCVSIMNEKNEVRSDAAAIRISKDEKHLYTSTRGRDLLTHFLIGEDGKVSVAQVYQAQGKTPRDFLLTDDEQYFIVAYQESNTVAAIARAENGDFGEVVDQVEVFGITCVKEALI